MITTSYKVKLILDIQDGVSDIQPDATFDDSAGYPVGFIMLVKDGTTWVCDDNTDGAAVWTQDTDKDLMITDGIRTITEVIPRYCNHEWLDSEYMRLADIIFSGDTLTRVGSGFDDTFFTGDTLWIYGSRRNDGVYDISAVTDDAITVSPDVTLDMTDDDVITLLSAVYPKLVQDIAARMVWFDVYVRPNRSPGLSSESIGSYSYSKMELVGGVDYPQDVIAGLGLYKRPKVV
jgi:hypothetical protein